MTKLYVRCCDFCKKEIKKLYDYGVTTLYKQIRVGRGHYFHDYLDDSIFNKVVGTEQMIMIVMELVGQKIKVKN